MYHNRIQNKYSLSSKKSRKRKTLETMSYRELEKALDRAYSEYIRLNSSDKMGCCVCITCGSVHFWTDIDCGHFITRAKKPTRFDEMNTHTQCKKCNRFRSGEPIIYRRRLIQLYGEKDVAAMEEKAYRGGSYCSYQLRQMIIEYREKVKILKLEKGL